jgi:hypothetical protein
VPLAALAAIGLLLGTPAQQGTAFAATKLTVPACEAGLNAWAATVNPAETYNIAPGLPLPRALGDDAVVPVFGTGVLAWTTEDVKAVSTALVACYQAAGKRRDAQTMNTLKAANVAVAGTLGKTVAWLDRVRPEVRKQQAAIAALPDSIELEKALGVLIEANPAKPDLAGTRGLPQAINTPVWAIAKVLPSLPDAEREALMASLGERRAALQAGSAGDIGTVVAAAAPTADGVIAIMQARQKISATTKNDALTAADSAAVARAEEIRASLRQAQPALWVPPDCAGLYRWSGADGARDSVRLGNRSTYALFGDERAVPVFGTSIGVWSEEDFARFSKVRAVCQTTWRSLPGAAAVQNPPPDAPELLKLAGKGAWIDTADGQIQQAAQTVRDYGAAMTALAAVQGRVAALPDTAGSIPQLHQLASDPAQQGVDEATRQKFRAAVLAKQNAISTKAAQGAIAALGDVKVDAMGDLVKLVAYGNQGIGTIPDAAGQQRFRQAYDQAMAAAIGKVMPQFRASLEKMPATLAGLQQVQTAVPDLTGVTQSEGSPVFAGFHNAAFDRTKAIVETLRKDNCAKLLEELDLDGGDAKELVWDGEQGNPLGPFVCGLTASGLPVKGYESGGLLAGDPKLKVVMGLGGVQTFTLHKAETANGQKMLIGYKLADANQEKPLSVQDWTIFAASSAGGRFVTRQICEPVLAKPEDALTAEERMIGVDCMIEIIQGRL